MRQVPDFFASMNALELSLSVTIRSSAVPIVIRVPTGHGSDPRSIAASSGPIINSSESEKKPGRAV